MKTHTLPCRLFSAALAAVLVFALTPFAPPGLSPSPVLADGDPAPGRTVFLNAGPGGFNEGNTSKGLLDPNREMFINGNRSGVGVLDSGAISLSPKPSVNGVNSVGGAFLSRRIYSETGFSARFQIHMGAFSARQGWGAADGWTFIVARDTNKLGGAGVQIGYGGIKNSYAFLYDTFYNPSQADRARPNAVLAHPADKVPCVSIGANGERNGEINYNEDHASSKLFVPVDARGVDTGKRYNNAKDYDLFGWVDYDSKESEMRFYLNDSPVMPKSPVSTIEANIESVLGNQYYIGFTAAGGGEWQEVLLRQFYVFNEYAPEVDFNEEGTDIVIPGQSESDRVVDYTPPSPPVIAQNAPGMTERLMAFTVGGSEDANGVRKYQYRIGDDSVWHDYADGAGFVLDGSKIIATPIELGGAVTVYARALDRGGNISNETEATLRYDIAPGPTLTSPADGARDLFPENARELVLSFKSRIDPATAGSVTVRDGAGADAAFAGGPVAANDGRWDPSYGKLTLPFAPGAVDYGKSYTVTVSGFVNTSGNPMNPQTETFSFSTIAREATPAAGIDYANETLTGFAPGAVYRINGAEHTAVGGRVSIDAAWFGTELRIVRPGTAATFESAAQTLAIPARRAAPNVGSRPGFITGTTADMEYAANAGAASWTVCTAGETAVANGTYYVRRRAAAPDFKSAAATVDVAAQTYTLNVDAVTFDVISSGDAQPAARPLAIRSSGNTAATITGVVSSDASKFIVGGGGAAVAAGGFLDTWTVRPAAGLPVGAHTAAVTVAYTGGRTATAEVRLTVREATPRIAIDYEKEQLTGFEQGRLYSVNGLQKTTGTGYIGIENAQLGTNLQIVRVNANTALNSLPQTLAIPPRGPAPAGIAAVAEAYAGENGALSGVLPSMEYRRAGAASWTDVVGGGDTVLAPGAYEVRYKAAAGARFHSAAVSAAIAASRNYKVSAQIALPSGEHAADAGLPGKSDTKYLIVKFTHANPANAAVPIAGFDEDAILSCSGGATLGTVADNGDGTWRVHVFPQSNGATATLTLQDSWTANGNTYTLTGVGTWNVTVYKAVREAKPNAQINYENEGLDNLVPGGYYRLVWGADGPLISAIGPNAPHAFGGAVRRADASGHISLAGFIPNAGESAATIRIIKRGESASVDSEAQELTIPARPAAPTGDIVQPTNSVNTGAIHIDGQGGAEYEYRSADGDTYAPLGSGVTTISLNPGMYYVRVKATASTAFPSYITAFHIIAFDSVDFGNVYEGYGVGDVGEAGGADRAVAQEITLGDVSDVKDLKLVEAYGSDGAPTDALPFEIASQSAMTVKPISGFHAASPPYTAWLKVTADDGSDTPTWRPVSLRVHPKAEITDVVAYADTSGMTNAITVTFEHSVPLTWEKITVNGGAAKAENASDFTNASGGTTYTIPVEPLMSRKTGDRINVAVNLADLGNAYLYQLSQPEAVLATSTMAAVTIPRAIEAGKTFAGASLPGYSTGFIQFTLDHDQNPIDPSAIAGAVSLTGVLAEVDSVVPVTNDWGYTYRVFLRNVTSGDVAVRLFNGSEAKMISEPVRITAGSKAFEQAAYFLNAAGHNYLTLVTDAYQKLPDSDANGAYAASPYTLRTSVASADVAGVYLRPPGREDFAELDPALYAATTETSRPFFLDGVDKFVDSRLQIALHGGWTDVGGAHRIVVVFSDASVAQGIVNVTNITSSHTLRITDGAPVEGRYPAGAIVPIAGRSPAASEAFVGWTQGDADIAQIVLPQGLRGTIVMPDADLSLTAHYVNRRAAPAAAIRYSAESLILPDGAYRFGEGNTVSVTNGAYPIDEAWFGGTVEIRRVDAVSGYPIASVDSLPQYLNIPARPASAPRVTAVGESVQGAKDGRILHAGGATEYSADGYAWIKLTDGFAAGLAPGLYYVRYAATDSAFASVYATVEIAEGAPSSSGGGTGGSGSGSTLPAVTADDGQVTLDYEKNEDGIVIRLPQNKVEEIIDKESGGTASFDLSKVADANAVTFLPKSGLRAIAERDLKIEIRFPRERVTLDREAVLSLVAQAKGDEITVELRERGAEELSPKQAAALPRDAGAFDISVRSGGVLIHDYKGEIVIVMPYAGRLPVQVWYLADDGAKERIPSEYSASDKTVSFRPPHLSVYVLAYGGLPFVDVAEGDWFFEDVAFVYAEGMMTGVSETEFAPQTAVTRGMMVTVLGRHFGADAAGYAAGAFADVAADAYFAPYIAWAAEAGIARGVGGNRFEPDRAITREDLATLLFRYAAFAGATLQSDPAVRLPFGDVADISDWATEAVIWAYAEGLLKGKPGNAFDPRGTATRAETAALLHRFAFALDEGADG
ncbi:MAG: S-layer homology domain-containing protein [Clostridiales Family XIII bacterium]|jgi:hypothetical protein|nr:S-layer homology domain-containing protein [Clostridiales Family XIII bacterium]